MPPLGPQVTGPRLLVDDEGNPLGRVAALDFRGPGVTVTRTGLVGTVTIPGGGTGATPMIETPAVFGGGSRPATVFTISNAPLNGVVLVNLNGQWLAPAIDYTVVSTTLTMVLTVAAGDSFFVFYMM